ncbi:phosphatidate cytidylyltransferase [Hyphococcus luteus]|uniref:Phosphatidate cytidylyltransferase n=1 Tax=Hyphococcus luteus TaxID=2058213 RepID=A0A2S7KAW5_9PROT|nr:phosphatidate cytidylyltransferase [Marinicaulis flavus]PQA89623.1 phosphatidate cytidylyltransferase [Marinicaulis flavus]
MPIPDALPDTVFYAIAVIYALLIAASVIVAVMKRKQPGAVTEELSRRVTSWWFMITIFSVAIVTNRVVSTVFLGFVTFLAFKEYLSLIPTRRVDRVILLFAYWAIPAQFLFAHLNSYGLFLTFIPVWMFLFLPMAMTLMGKTEGFLRAVGTLSWGLMITVFALSHTAMLLAADKSVAGPAGGAGLLLFLVALTQFNDVAQFTWGRLFGKHKIAPQVSPKKTWEGFLGGLGSTVVGAAIAGPFLTPMPFYYAGVAGAIIAVAGFLGDITISSFKRDLGVKDSGGLIPGHGGILDRVDSLIYAAPVFYHAMHFFVFSGRI